MWRWLCTERERAIRIWNHIRSEEDMKKYCEAKKDVQRVVYMAMDKKAREALEKLICVVMVVSCLELQSKRVGEKKDVVGVSCLKDQCGTVEVSVDDRVYGKLDKF